MNHHKLQLVSKEQSHKKRLSDSVPKSNLRRGYFF